MSWYMCREEMRAAKRKTTPHSDKPAALLGKQMLFLVILALVVLGVHLLLPGPVGHERGALPVDSHAASHESATHPDLRHSHASNSARPTLEPQRTEHRTRPSTNGGRADDRLHHAHVHDGDNRESSRQVNPFQRTPAIHEPESRSA